MSWCQVFNLRDKSSQLNWFQFHDEIDHDEGFVQFLLDEAAQSESQKSRENLQGQALPAVEGGGEGGSGHDMSIPEIRGILPH